MIPRQQQVELMKIEQVELMKIEKIFKIFLIFQNV